MSLITFDHLAGPAFAGVLPQSDNGVLNYCFLKDNDDIHLVMHSLDENGERTSFIASKNEYKKLIEKKVAVSRAGIEKHCGTLESYSSKIAAETADLPAADEQREDVEKDNKLQFAEEAKAARNKALIDSIREMFRNPKIDCQEITKIRNLPSSMTVNIPLAPPNGPVSINTLTSCSWGQLQFVITRITPKKMIITNNDIVYDDYRTFMYNVLQKSSKTSMGIGINFDIGSSLFSGGPVIGDTIYADGVEQKDNTGIGLKFNMTKIKQYYELTIKATQRIIATSKCTTTVIDM